MTSATDQVSGKTPGALMRAEAAEAKSVFCESVMQSLDWSRPVPRSIYTIARGSSDAAACMLWYEYMVTLGVPVTSLPPSAFSILGGVAMQDALALVISQSGGSDDLVRSARGAREKGGYVTSILNAEGSGVEAASDLVVRVGAGDERAVPATKSVIGTVAAGMALLAAIAPEFGAACKQAADAFATSRDAHPDAKALQAALLRARNVYVIGRGSGFGAAQEVALKLKETCALHAEAYSASEVLHGPLQLVANPLLVIALDTGAEETQPSLDAAETRFRDAGSKVFRLRATDVSQGPMPPAAAAALLLNVVYPIILETALALGFDPDAPDLLAKVTKTL